MKGREYMMKKLMVGVGVVGGWFGGVWGGGVMRGVCRKGVYGLKGYGEEVVVYKKGKMIEGWV